MTEEQKVPLGIVAFKGSCSGDIIRLRDSEKMHGRIIEYEEWANALLNPWPGVKPNTIHTISVDGKEWSVGEEYNFGYSGRHKVNSFRWRNGEWEAESGGGYILVKGLSKYTPPNPSLNKEEGKEENTDRDFIAELVLKWYDPALYPNLTSVEHKIRDCKEYYKKNEQAYKTVKYTAREKRIIQEWIHESLIDKFSRSTHPDEIDVICPDCGYPNNGHGLPSNDKSKPQPPLPEQGKEEKFSKADYLRGHDDGYNQAINDTRILGPQYDLKSQPSFTREDMEGFILWVITHPDKWIFSKKLQTWWSPYLTEDISTPQLLDNYRMI